MNKAKDESNSKIPGAYYLLFGLLFRLKTRKNVQNTSYTKQPKIPPFHNLYHSIHFTYLLITRLILNVTYQMPVQQLRVDSMGFSTAWKMLRNHMEVLQHLITDGLSRRVALRVIRTHIGHILHHLPLIGPEVVELARVQMLA